MRDGLQVPLFTLEIVPRRVGLFRDSEGAISLLRFSKLPCMAAYSSEGCANGNSGNLDILTKTYMFQTLSVNGVHYRNAFSSLFLLRRICHGGQDGEDVLLFPGGAREVCKRKVRMCRS